MELLFGLVPVCFFLLALYMLDSFKLVRWQLLMFCLLWGMTAAGIAYFFHSWLIDYSGISDGVFPKYIAPLSEELLKAAVVVALALRRKIGFAVDAAIYGLASGAGFSLIENVVYYIQLGSGYSMAVWILRGFGTAIMHGGCTALFAIILIGGIHRERHVLVAIVPAFLAATALHSAFNHFILNPFLQTAVIVIALPLILTLVFRQSTHRMQQWLEVEFSSEVDMLRMIRQGKFLHTKAGEYLASIKQYFAAGMIVDMYCYIALYLELSIKAKRNVMLKENGLPLLDEPGIAEKLQELSLLRNQIGKTGEMALKPLVRMNHRELWKLNQLKNSAF